jgi:dihydrofolate synthase/folylpolyglutamate synthase
MTLKEKIAFLESRPRFKPKTDLDHLKTIFASLDIHLPELKIHVVGTNGKGSTTMMMTHILKQRYKVGSFISPYVYTFNERILIDGEEISDVQLEKGLDDVFKVYDIHPSLTFFELLTLMALMIFSKLGCEAIVMEAGIGGRLDATNILTYPFSLIVSIGHDHLQVLGPTLFDILNEKIAVLKPHGHLLSTVDARYHSHIQVFASQIENAQVTFLDSYEFQVISQLPLCFQFKSHRYTLKFIGNHYASNARLAIEVGLLLHIDVKTIQSALSNTTMKGRFEEITPGVFMDGAHNQEAIDQLFQTLSTTYRFKEKIIIMSVLGDKDIASMMKQLKHPKHRIILTSFEDPRYQDISMHQSSEVLFIPQALDAYVYAKNILAPDGMIIFTGSIHFIGYIGSKIKQTLYYK